MSMIEDMAKKVAQTLVGLDDIVLFREIADKGMQQATDAGRSMVGAALVGGGLAARTATLGVQLGTKSAKAATDAVKGMVPGADVAGRVVDDMDRRIGESGQKASRLAAHGAGIGRSGGMPTNPLTGETWLEKSLGEGEGWNTLLADSTVDLARFFAMPLTLGVGAGEAAAATPAGREFTRYSWNAMSSAVDMLAGTRGEGSEDRAEARAAMLALGLAPLACATRDLVDVSEGMTRLAFGDGRKLRDALSGVVERLDLGDEASAGDQRTDDDLGLIRALRERSKKASQHTPERVLAAGEAAGDGLMAQYSRHASALVEDGNNLSSLALVYTELMTRLGVNAAHAVLNGWRDVNAIDDWVDDDESERDRSLGGRGTDRRRPAAIEQLEAIASAVGPLETDDKSRSFFSRAALELARDTVYAYTARALDRDKALERVQRVFGAAARDNVRDDCSLRSEVRDARSPGARLQALQDVASELRREDLSCLIRARDHAADRLQALERGDNVIENLLTPRHAERVEALQSFVGLVDQSLAFEGSPQSSEPARRRVFNRLETALNNLHRRPAA